MKSLDSLDLWLLIIIGAVFAIVLLRQLLKVHSYNRWLFMMRKTMRLPDMKDCGDGWCCCTCTNCYHTFLWWREDECICTRCGVDYHHSKHLFDKFDGPPEDWQPMA